MAAELASASNPGERVDVEEANAKSLIDQGIAEAVQGDHLGALIEKQIGGMLEGLTRGLNETITKILEQFAKSQTLSRKNAVISSDSSPAPAASPRGLSGSSRSPPASATARSSP